MIQVSPIHTVTITYFTNNGYLSAVKELIPVFESRTGYKINIQNDIIPAIYARALAGEFFDVITANPPEFFKNMEEKGLIVPGSICALAKGSIGVAVKAGTPHPKIQTVEQFTEALLRARKIAFTDPSTGGLSGIHFVGLLKRLNIEDKLNEKGALSPTKQPLPGVTDKLLSGEADIAVQQIAELMLEPGVEIVGGLPEELQLYMLQSGAIGAKTKNPGPAQALLDFFCSSETHEFIRSKGLIPVLNK